MDSAKTKNVSATAHVMSPPPSSHHERPGRHAVTANDTRTITSSSRSAMRYDSVVATTLALPSVACCTGMNTVPAASAPSVRPASAPSMTSQAGNGRIRSRSSSAIATYSSAYMPR